MEDFLLFFLTGMLGAELANKLTKENYSIKIPFILIYCIIFAFLYTLAIIFFSIIFFIKGFIIPWQGVGIACLTFSFSIAAIISIIDKLKTNQHKKSKNIK